jgi:hypothetical protein
MKLTASLASESLGAFDTASRRFCILASWCFAFNDDLGTAFVLESTLFFSFFAPVFFADPLTFLPKVDKGALLAVVIWRPVRSH